MSDKEDRYDVLLLEGNSEEECFDNKINLSDNIKSRSEKGTSHVSITECWA